MMEKSGTIFVLRVFVDLKRMIEGGFWYIVWQYRSLGKNG